jgi:hypothetical protein
MNPAVQTDESPLNLTSGFRLLLEELSNSDNEEV